MSDKVKTGMAVGVSLIALGAALFVILGGESFPQSSSEWAYGVVGLILGYWLK